MQAPHERWFTRFSRQSRGQLRLFCFPYAGGDAQAFRNWPDDLSCGIDVVGVTYPGRGKRFGEPLVHDLPDLVDALVQAMRPMLDRPFAFYGHSNGALVAYELARQVSLRLMRRPEFICLAAKRSPLLPPEAPLHRLPDAAFLDVVKSYGGTPDTVLQTPELLDLYLPILKADFALSETYRLSASTRLAVPCHLISGAHDTVTHPKDVEAWHPLFSGPVSEHRIPGGHFFLHTHRREVTQIIDQMLAPAL
jgi:medium-chain acyl-[acyl-carrier-protein] hydrolase